jgi:selenocysteine lyase/cysteine desulfurase
MRTSASDLRFAIDDLRARASFYLDNTQAEVDRFVEVVKEI